VVADLSRASVPQALFGVFVHQFLKQVSENWIVDVTEKLVVLDDFLFHLPNALVVLIKRGKANDHLKNQRPKTPPVNARRYVFSFRKSFRRQVLGRARNFTKMLILFPLNITTEPKINQPHIPLFVDHHILRFQTMLSKTILPIQVVLRVHVLKCQKNLSCVKLSPGYDKIGTIPH
jgi:hypothetical protein